MKASSKRILCTVTAVILTLVTLGAALSVFFAPLFSVHTTDQSFDHRFKQGEYTKSLFVPKVELGIFSVISEIKNFKYLTYIINHQAYTAEIKGYEAEIKSCQDKLLGADLEADIQHYEALIQANIDKIEVVRTKLTQLDSGLSAEEKDRIPTLLENESFVNLLAGYYLIGEGASILLGNTVTGIDIDSTYSWGSYYLGMILSPIAIVMLICFVIAFVILVFVFLIQAITSVVSFCKHVSAQDHTLVQHCENKLVYYALTVSSIFFVFLKLVLGVNFEVGLCFILLGIFYFASRITLTVYQMATAEKQDVTLYVKQIFALISAIVLVIAALTFISSGFISGVLRDADAFGSTYMQEFPNSDGGASLVKKEVSNTVMIKTAIVSALALVIGIIATYLAFVSVEKLAMQRYKTAQGVKNYSAKYILTAILLIGVIVLSQFGALTPEEQKEAFSEGKYRYLIGAYAVTGDADYTDYTALTLEKGILEGVIERYESGDFGEDISDPALFEKQALKAYEQLEDTEYRMRSLERENASLTLLIVLYAIALVSEIAYLAVPAVIEKSRRA